MTRTRKDITRRAEYLGLFVTTYSPGDGQTRYRFSRKDEDYFALGGNDSFTALGIKEADAMLDAYLYGRTGPRSIDVQYPIDRAKAQEGFVE